MAIIELVIDTIGRPRRLYNCRLLDAKQVRRRGAGAGAGVEREAEVAAPKLVCATPHKALRNQSIDLGAT